MVGTATPLVTDPNPLNWLVITLCGISVVAFAVWPLNLVG